jgi:hypothetical protein
MDTLSAFFDELEKIGAAIPGLGMKHLLGAAALGVGGGVAGTEGIHLLKRRYDIGKAFEQQQAEAEQAQAQG